MCSFCILDLHEIPFISRKYLSAIAGIPCVKIVCEIGFNAGHSSLLWLSASPDITVYTFDNLLFDYVQAAVRYIMDLYPGRFHLIAGDSTKSVPFASLHTKDKCDVMFIDGNHFDGGAYIDMVNFRSFANPDFHVLILDDVFCNEFYCEDPTRCLKKAINENLVEEVHHATVTLPGEKKDGNWVDGWETGFSIGTYVDLE